MRLRANNILLALALLASIVARARADLPGTIPLAASGDGHFWWVVRSTPQASGQRAAPSTAGAATYALMHHAADAPAPCERLVMRLSREPIALAAEGTRVVVVTRGDASGRAFIISMFAARNEAVGHWFTMPRGAPLVIPALPVDGEIRALALSADTLGALVRVRRADPRAPERYWFGTASCESSAAGGWQEGPLPGFDLSEQTRLFARGSTFAALGMRGGSAVIAELGASGWTVEGVARSDGPIAPRAVLGGFEVDRRTALVERVDVAGGGGLIRVGLLRDRTVQPWAEFTEPVRPWSLGGFGSQALLVEIGDASRAMVRALPFSASAPSAAVGLNPPGFASGSWIHLPIIGILSVALVLAAVLFGSDAYLERRGIATVAGAPAAPRAFRGAPLSARSTAILIDMLPGLVAVWFVFRGSPLDLLRIPAFQPDLVASLPALFVFASGWLVATIGDLLFGRSMGKRIVGLRIVSARGGDATLLRRAVRAFGSAITMVSPLVMLVALLNPRGDGPAEMISGTAVVSEDELAAQQPAPPPEDGL